MTIGTTARSESYEGDGATLLFSVPFQFRAAADLRVILIGSDGSEAMQALGVHYSVSGGNGAAGNVTMAAAPAMGQRLLIEGAMPIRQSREWETADRFPAASTEGAADDSAIHAQELRRDIARFGDEAVRVPRGEYAAQLPKAIDRAGKLFAFDAQGDPVMSSGTGADGALRSDLADGTSGAGLVSFLRAMTGAVVRSVADIFEDRTSVMDFIPLLERVKIRLRTSTADHSGYFRAAAVAVNGGIAAGAGPGGSVLVPAGTYNAGNVPMRDTHFYGESRNGTVIKALATGGNVDGSQFVFDACLDRDGSTENSFGNGSVNCLTVDCADADYSGVRTFGGGQFMKDVWVTGALVGFAIGLPIRCVFDGLRAEACRIVGFYTYSHPGDTATSSVFNACQATDCYRGWHITQISYSAWNACVGENSTEINWFIEGNANGVTSLNSLIFNAPGHEGTGVPFYFRKCRDFVINTPRSIGADGTSHLMTLDDFAGEIGAFSTPGPPNGGKAHLDIINHASGNGSIVLRGCVVALADFNAQIGAVTLLGSILNGGQLATSGFTIAIDSPTAVQRSSLDIANLDGYSGVRLMASDGTRLHAWRRIGGEIISSNGAMLDAAAFGPGDMHFYLSNDNKLHLEGMRPDGTRITAEVTLTSVSNPT